MTEGEKNYKSYSLFSLIFSVLAVWWVFIFEYNFNFSSQSSILFVLLSTFTVLLLNGFLAWLFARDDHKPFVKTCLTCTITVSIISVLIATIIYCLATPLYKLVIGYGILIGFPIGFFFASAIALQIKWKIKIEDMSVYILHQLIIVTCGTLLIIFK
jgi:hypothetical protein